MKYLFNILAVSALFGALFFTSCSDDDSDNDCFVDNLLIVPTDTTDYALSNSVTIDFDVTNTSSRDFDPASNLGYINYTMIVTTTDGTSYETSDLFPILSLSAGATTTTFISGDYGAGKTFASYTYSLECRF